MKVKARFGLVVMMITGLMLIGPHPVFAQGDPEVEELMELSLEELMNVELAGRGEVGSFGYRLADSDAAISIHGYATTEYIDQEKKPGTFDQHYFNLFVTGKLGDQIPEHVG